ncbi:MAG: hypothetical protein LUH05_03095 [Candidatus Gastranaerophilales bacterium]|nr:hypothetical protein [Candidatus Gastranaerophilales bacterium]
MYFEYNETTGVTDVCVEVEKDICAECIIRQECPLLNSLSLNIVYPSAMKLELKDCLFYREYVDIEGEENEES